MYNSFFSLLHFSNEFTNNEIELIKKCVEDLQLTYLQKSLNDSFISKNNELTTYSYIINYESYKEILEKKSDVFITHSVDRPLYIKFEQAIQNFFRFYPNKNYLDFEEIKALNIMDKILVPFDNLKIFLKSNYIDEQKIYFLPFVLKVLQPIFTTEKNKIICYCNFENNLWQKLFKAFETLSKIFDFEFDIYIETNNNLSFEEINKQIKNYIKSNSIKINFNFIDYKYFSLENISKKILFLDLTENFDSNIRKITALAHQIPIIYLENIFNNDSNFCEFSIKNNFTVDELINKIKTIFPNYEFYKKEIFNISKEIKKIYSIENFEHCLKKLLEESLEKYNNNRNFLLGKKEFSKYEYKNLNSTKKLAQVITQLKKVNDFQKIKIDEVIAKNIYSISDILEKINFETKVFGFDEWGENNLNSKKNCLILNQVFENIDDSKIKELLNKSIEHYQYIIISCKSENYPQKNYRSKDILINLLSEFNIVQETYYGNPEFKLAEKEYFLIVIKGNIKDINEIDYITWEGSQFFYNSLAVINKELELKFDESKKYEISVIPQDFYSEITPQNYPFYSKIENLFNKILLKKTNFFIRHSLPANFNSPNDGYYILIFPWETGNIPKALVEHINKTVDQLWCPSNYVKELHKKSGVLTHKLKVVPNGINPNIYNPFIEPIDLKTDKKFKFLFLGGLVFRKGIDILLQAYEEEFSKDDDVCLVLKGLGEKTYYKQDSFTKKILDFSKDPTKPQIIFINDNFSIMEMGKIYTSCQCYVQPYRAEGFGMPITEAMACSLPVIVTNFGASLDFCNENNSLLLDYNIKTEILKDVDGLEKETSYIEPNKEHLKKLMRYAFENQKKIKELGKQANEDITKKFSWDSVFNIIQNCFCELKEKPIFRNNIKQRIDFLIKELEQSINNNDKNNVLSILYELDILLIEKEEYLELFANTYYFLDENKKALEYFLVLLKKFPKNKNIIVKTAKTLERLGDVKTAKSFYKILESI